ncbi:MAG: RAD55 family ATPase [Candidatus Thermoplasmatota archaeon]|jgi:KaiC/GvpD/RAD55 family RecA-like ATPase|nr:RAD55 family ATPase [Candidatus Thermoplasmatota archaeon]
MTNEEFISTGIEKLDKLLEGGIPRGFTVLILGTPGSSVEILSKQLTTTGKVLYFTTEETKNEVLDTMKRFNWNPREIEFVDIAEKYSQSVLSGEQKRVSIYEQRSKLKLKELIEIGSSGLPPTIKGDEDFLAILSNKIKSSNYQKIVINSLDFFLSQYSQDEVIRTVYAAKLSNLQNKGALFIIMTRGIYGDVFERKMEGTADCVLELEVLQKGSTFERFLSVKKMRNYAKKIGIARYTIDSDGFVLEMIERIM